MTCTLSNSTSDALPDQLPFVEVDGRHGIDGLRGDFGGLVGHRIADGLDFEAQVAHRGFGGDDANGLLLPAANHQPPGPPLDHPGHRAHLAVHHPSAPAPGGPPGGSARGGRRTIRAGSKHRRDTCSNEQRRAANQAEPRRVAETESVVVQRKGCIEILGVGFAGNLEGRPPAGRECHQSHVQEMSFRRMTTGAARNVLRTANIVYLREEALNRRSGSEAKKTRRDKDRGRTLSISAARRLREPLQQESC